MKYCCESLKNIVEGSGGIYPPEEDPEIYPDEQIWEIGWAEGSIGNQRMEFREIFYCPFCGKELEGLKGRK